MGDNYWSATATLLGHADVRPASGKAEVFLDSWRDYVALQVLSVTADTVAPTVTNTGATYEGSADTPTNISTLVLAGTNFNTLLEAAETANTDIKGRLDWSKLSWDINSDNATTADVSFAQGDISSANVTDSTHLTIVLTNEKGASLEATSGFRGNSADAIDIAAGFSTDYWGNAATTDTVANESITSLAETWINLGSYGKLIKPVQVDGGKTYFFWDAYNGTAVGNVSQIGSNPPGWKAYGYWSATKAAPMDSATVHFIVDQHGGVRPLWDNYFMPYHVAVEFL